MRYSELLLSCQAAELLFNCCAPDHLPAEDEPVLELDFQLADVAVCLTRELPRAAAAWPENSSGDVVRPTCSTAALGFLLTSWRFLICCIACLVALQAPSTNRTTSSWPRCLPSQPACPMLATALACARQVWCSVS